MEEVAAELEVGEVGDTCWLLFFVIVISAVVAPLPQTIHHISSAAVVLHLIRCHPPPHLTIIPSPPLHVLCIS
jgi:hypothetical protein